MLGNSCKSPPGFPSRVWFLHRYQNAAQVLSGQHICGAKNIFKISTGKQGNLGIEILLSYHLWK